MKRTPGDLAESDFRIAFANPHDVLPTPDYFDEAGAPYWHELSFRIYKNARETFDATYGRPTLAE